MIRKKLALLIVCLCSMLLIGCEQVIELTDEETQLIAEYSAELLLKYDINYVDRIDDGNQKAEELASEALEEATEVVTEQTTEQNTTEQGTSQEEATEHTKTDASGDAQMQESADRNIGTENNIAVIAGIDGMDITFREYSIVEKYPATDEQGEFIYLEASEGYQLLVLHFDVVNTTQKLVSLSLLDKEIDYRVVCNGSKAANPMLTILMDDLGTLETNVEPGVPQEAVLVFQVSDSMQAELEMMDLYVTYNDIENVIKILQ